MINLFDIKFTKKFPFVIIPKERFVNIIFICLVTGFLAWILETVFCILVQEVIADRGFLCGPFIPLFAITMFFILLFVRIPKKSFKNFLLSSLIIGVLVTIMEAVVGNLLEILFDLELWCYEGNIPLSSTYISLPISIGWGLGGTLYLMILVPLFDKLFNKLKFKTRIILITIILGIIFIDLGITIYLIVKNGGYNELYVKYL